MKLLLTSGGLENQKIIDALIDLIGKPLSESSIAVITIAKNAQAKEKSRLIRNLNQLLDIGFGYVDLVDPSAGGVGNWRERLDGVDCIYIYGGNTFFLLYQARKSGLADYLKQNINSYVYLANSAGTILATPTIRVASIPPGDENEVGLTDMTGLGLVDFEIEPHCDDERFAMVEKYAKDNDVSVYAIDDQTTLKVVDGQVEAVTEGTWKKFN